jgi:hypothetical protein
MDRRPSRIVTALARWALMAGLAGIVLAALAFIDRFRESGNVESQHALLVLAAILLSLSFVLAPFVRRAFGLVLTGPRQRERRKTLLDEMRERPEGEWMEAPASPAPSAPSSEQRSVLTRLILVLYLIFGVVLIAVLLAVN